MDVMIDLNRQQPESELQCTRKRTFEDFASATLSQENEPNIEPSDAPRPSRKLPWVSLISANHDQAMLCSLSFSSTEQDTPELECLSLSPFPSQDMSANNLRQGIRC